MLVCWWVVQLICFVVGTYNSYTKCCWKWKFFAKMETSFASAKRKFPFKYQFLPERDYVTFGSFLPQFCLSSVCHLSVTLVHPTQEVEAFGNISLPLCTLAILWLPCKILRRSSQGNSSAGSVKRKTGIKIERFWTYRRLYLINGTR